MTYNRHDIVAKVQAQVTANPKSHLYDLVATLGVERHTIGNAFRSLTGLSFRDFSKKERLQIGVHLLLKEGQRSEKDIAHQLGYRSTRAFGRFIKTNTGQTPGEIRNGSRTGRTVRNIQKRRSGRS